MIDRVKTRLGSEQGFTLIELLVVIIILGILVAIAVPSYLSFRGKAQDAAAQANVRSAIPAAESYYQSNGSYTGMTLTALQSQAPGVSPDVGVTVSTAGQGYCLDDTAVSGHEYYYIGGTNDWTGMTGTMSVISSGACSSVVSP